MPIGSIEDIWAAVCEECKKTISEVAFNCFLKDLKPVSLDGGVSDGELKMLLDISFRLTSGVGSRR